MDETTPSYNLNVVVRETNIKPDTLRAWERRYGLPNPVRTDGGHRLYSDRDIEMIKWFIARQEEGMRISQIVKMWQEMTAEGIDPLAPPRQSIQIQPISEDIVDVSVLAQMRNAWIEACTSFNESEAEQILAQSFARYPVELVTLEVIQKGLAEIGQKWFEGAITVQQEHFASALALRKIHALIAAAPAPTYTEKILVSTAPGEQHTVSPLLLVLFLRNQGWDVTYLGADVPLEDLEKTINQVSPDLVINTATMFITASTLLKTAEFLNEKNIQFAFGGRIFSENNDLVNFVPGYFLGSQLNGVVQKVAEILTGKQTPHTSKKNNEELQSLAGLYSSKVTAIHSRVLERYTKGSNLNQLVHTANQFFSQTIQAGLTFGDLNLISPDMDWIDSLLSNKRLPNALLTKYFQYYQNAVEEELGTEGEILSNWLETLTK